MVCFGMVSNQQYFLLSICTSNLHTNLVQLIGIPATYKQQNAAQAMNSLVRLANPQSFVGVECPGFGGEVSPDYTFLTEALTAETSLELQITCTPLMDPPKLAKNGKRPRASASPSKCSLDLILYGPLELADNICLFIDECNEYLDDERKLYLQDPVGCKHNVQYLNPQKLLPLDSQSIQLTVDLAEKHRRPIELEDLESQSDLLSLLDSQEDLPEAMQPPAIRTSLKR
jgi:hypothetical protein